MRKLHVVDMSHYQTVSELDGMRVAGIVGVIHKATEGESYKDPKYAPRRQWFIENGFAFASYHFLRPGSLAAQMRHYIETARPDEGEVVILDYEAAGLKLGDLKEAVAWLRSYVPKNPICIYGGHLLEEQIGSTKIEWLAGTTLWTAEYTTRDAPKWPTGTWPKWSLWQYSDGKSGGEPHDVAGVSQVDCNEFSGTDDECRAWFKRPAVAARGPLSVEERLSSLEAWRASVEVRS
jgi:lysozyme